MMNVDNIPKAEVKQKAVIVLPQYREAVEMFQRIFTQWRMGPGGPVGLDYNALQWMCSLYSVHDARQLLEDLQIMERAWLSHVYGE